MTAMPWWVPWVGAGVLVVIATALWWWVPKWQANLLSMKIRDPKARADVEDNFRKNIGQLLGGATVLAGTWIAYNQILLTSQLSRDQLISQQVSKGFEQLGNKDNVVLRLGGIYALEGVMNTSEQYHQPVLEALCAFVRDNAKSKIDKDNPKGSDAPATDIQAALTVVGRRKDGPGIVDLSWADLTGADLIGANLTGAKLTGANLSHARLTAQT
jgi:Pentapeptide repeats (8 copies)